MTLIFILIALGCDQLSDKLEDYRNFNWFIKLHYWFEKRLAHYQFWGGSFGLLILLSIPVIALLILVSFVDDSLWVTEVLLTLIGLMYCLAPHDLNNRLNHYIAAMDGAYTDTSIAATLVNKAVVNDDDSEEIAIIKSTLVEAHRRTFAIIFWFSILGVVGAFLYRLVDTLNDELHDIRNNYADSVRLLLAILEWPTSRLMVIGLALSGNLVATLPAWKKSEQFSFERNKEFLMQSGIKALQYTPESEGSDRKQSYWIGELQSLIKRTLFIWLAILGIMTLSGITV